MQLEDFPNATIKSSLELAASMSFCKGLSNLTPLGVWAWLNSDAFSLEMATVFRTYPSFVISDVYASVIVIGSLKMSSIVSGFIGGEEGIKDWAERRKFDYNFVMTILNYKHTR